MKHDATLWRIVFIFLPGLFPMCTPLASKSKTHPAATSTVKGITSSDQQVLPSLWELTIFKITIF